jgi:hypothetical protein
MTWLLTTAAVSAAVLLGVELLLRSSGLGSFPLFEPAEHGVYRMRANQSGRFRRRIRWHYDAHGMRSDETPGSFAGTTLLVGDSIVDGGIRIDQDETLAATASRLSGESLYPVACHGWSLANGLLQLRELRGWSDTRRLVFVLNTGDLDSIAELGSELSFPTRRPIWLSLWLLRRHLSRYASARFHPRLGRNGVVLPLTDRNEGLRASNLAGFKQLLAEYAGPVFVVRYPMRGEDARVEGYFEELASLDPRVRLLEAGHAPDWSAECYADHIHPNAKGIAILARHLCQGLS